jgi:hypothetical protein
LGAAGAAAAADGFGLLAPVAAADGDGLGFGLATPAAAFMTSVLVIMWFGPVGFMSAGLKPVSARA